MDEIRKQYKFSSDIISKIEKLKYAKEQENPSVKIYEKDILVDAINLAYSAKFGKEVFDQTMSKLELVLGNMMKKVLSEYAERFARSHENLFEQNEEIKEMLLLVLRASNVLPDDQNKILALMLGNLQLSEMIHDAVILKQES